MEKYVTLNINDHKEAFNGVLLCVVVGIAGYSIHVTSKTPIVDPLVVSMIIGIIIRAIVVDAGKFKKGFSLATSIFIPVGLVFYSAHNLNFAKVVEVKTGIIVLLILVLIAYFTSILIAGRILRQKKQITYLTATGSAICGASAIVITSPAVEAEPDDVSISLISVVIASLTGLFIILPFLATFFGITNKTYGLLSGMVLQFTGMVRIAVETIPYLDAVMPARELVSLSLSVKAVRFLGLLIAIPVFASLVKRKFYISWVPWVFLISGVIGTWIYTSHRFFYTDILIPFIRPLHMVSWSIALASIGLSASAEKLLSNNGARALIMVFIGFFAATITFFAGLYLMEIF